MSSAYPLPAVRRLKVYAFDPQASVTLATAMINDYVIELPWEERWESPLDVGPVNDYVEVIDYDPAAGLFYAPIDLNHPNLLAQNGLDPSEGRPQFHQQMVFAVVMRTIRAFERALGRVVLWARDEEVPWDAEGLSDVERNFTRRLRIYPHGLREANAYYSPVKRALLFGYFNPGGQAAEVQAKWVFTCLSQDIIAHETTHAILHGMRQRSIEPSNIDAMAFHEAFADIIALLQHFSMSVVVRQLLCDGGGSLRGPGLLTGLGEQFGRATGRDGALRYALRVLNKRAETPTEDSPENIDAAIARLRDTTEPHARGGFLVAAVFDAFVTIYERRTADLRRLARPGQVEGNGLNPDLVARLADEAAKTADQVMRMCVRALDYAPPVDMRFGEYLRAIISADTDLVPNDPLRYRVAFVEAFKRWGITVPGCISMAPDSLLWDPPRLEDYPEITKQAELQTGRPLQDPADALNIRFTDLLGWLQFGVSFEATGKDETPAEPLPKGEKLVAEAAPSPELEPLGAEPPKPVSFTPNDFNRDSDDDDDISGSRRNLRYLSMKVVLQNQRAIHKWFDDSAPDDEDWERLLGMRLLPENRAAQRKKRKDGWSGFANAKAMRSLDCKGKARGTGLARAEPFFEVHSARVSRRIGPDGHELHMLIIQLSQKRRGYFAPEDQAAAEKGAIGKIGAKRWMKPDFWFRGGATLHVDLRDGRLLRIIRKRIDNDERLEAERAYRCGETTGTVAAAPDGDEPFAFMHRSS